MKVKLETLANLMIVITGAAVTTLFVSRVIAENRQAPSPAPVTYRVGEKLAAAGAPVDFSKAPQTLVVVLSSQCHFCTESVPLYHDLLKAREHANPRTRMVAIGLEDSSTLQRYLKEHDLTFDEVSSVPRSRIKFRGTPTMVLLDQSGTVKGVWAGFLTSEQRKGEVIQMMSAGHV